MSTTPSQEPAASSDPRLTVFVNSVDSYSDCWAPFFTLLQTHWPEVPQPVLLNTERQEFHHPDLAVHSTCTAHEEGPGVLRWGERFRRGLAQVPSEFVLYLVEDAFITGRPRLDVLERLIDLMESARLDCVRLVEPDGAGPYVATPWPDVVEVDQSAEYLAMLQAALWRTDVLRSLVAANENPWQFESRGGRRIRRAGYRVHAVDRERYWHDPASRILPYHPDTGIKMGRWNAYVVADLFAEHGIDVDLGVRGIRDTDRPRTLLVRLRDRVEGKLRTILPGWDGRGR